MLVQTIFAKPAYEAFGARLFDRLTRTDELQLDGIVRVTEKLQPVVGVMQRGAPCPLT
ncbi:hypothetical protein [Paraburkholderia tropica]|jgi:hypothetical protein|uniref:hypothetical protein n=1 Tax=Paraburkholderia tropica TaxID=92647 RepID=UPI002AB6EE6C|nr:hypothetical protein [Paraburkholderia tropica]